MKNRKKIIIEQLNELHLDDSKHAHYQPLPERVKRYIDFTNNVDIQHYDIERLHFMRKNVDFQERTILDIGGNLGYFSFGALDSGASEATLIEGKSRHVEIVKLLAELNESNIKTVHSYLDFKSDLTNDYFDIVFYLNVIHHLGDDFGSQKLSKEQAKEKMLETFNFFAGKCETLIFQMGFCWKGDRNQLLFENGTKSELIDFVKEGIKDQWFIEEIGVAEKHQGIISYEPVNDTNILRQDSLGEFLNRPIFILKFKK